MKITIPKLRRVIRKVLVETYTYDSEGNRTDGSREDIINLCVKDLQRDPDADIDTVCERWASLYGIPYDELQKIKDAVYQRS